MGVPVSLPHPPGPKPVGDPAAMRALADEVRRIGDLTGRLGGPTFLASEWNGHSARAFAPRLRDEEHTANVGGLELRFLALQLDVAADEVTRDLLHWHRYREAYEAAVATFEGQRHG